jgi:hypothetical protein
MGCGEMSKIKKTQVLLIPIRNRVSRELKRGETIATSSQFSSRVGSVQMLVSAEKVCLKFNIFEDFQDLMPQKPNSSPQCSPEAEQYIKDLKYIKRFWVSFKSAMSYFNLMTHGCCIEDFSVTDGILILLISNLASKNSFGTDMEITAQPPYIQFLSAYNCHGETILIIRAWQNLSDVLDKFTSKKKLNFERILERFGVLIAEYSSYDPAERRSKAISKSWKRLKALIENTKGLLNDIEESQKAVKKFALSFRARKAEIESFGQIAFQFSCFTGEQIVHHILSK